MSSIFFYNFLQPAWSLLKSKAFYNMKIFLSFSLGSCLYIFIKSWVIWDFVIICWSCWGSSWEGVRSNDEDSWAGWCFGEARGALNIDFWFLGVSRLNGACDCWEPLGVEISCLKCASLVIFLFFLDVEFCIWGFS